MVTRADHYCRAIYPDRHRVLGRRLRPITVGHAILLHRLRNPILADTTGTVHPEPRALAQAVWVCSLHHRTAAWLADGPAWWSRWLLAPLVRRALREPGAWMQFVRYLSGVLELPRHWADAGAQQPGGGAKSWFWAGVHVGLVSQLGLSPRAALDLPIAQAMAMLYVLAEQHGRIESVTEEIAEILHGAKPTFRPKTPPPSTRN